MADPTRIYYKPLRRYLAVIWTDGKRARLALPYGSYLEITL